ncbi:MAG TPA: FHIPEP family type III secretion protein, partial [Desulfopila sp.]|nr:FHIPEP family type III secretion protein [Desulfopila sp.]
FTHYSMAIWVVAGILLVFALIPGLPFFPFLTLSISLGLLGYYLDKKKAREEALPPETKEAAPVRREENYEEMLNIDLLELEVGYGLIPFVDANQDGELLTRIQSIRKQFAMNNGFIVPPIHIKDNLQLNPNQYTVALKGVRVAESEILPGYFMAMDPGIVTEKIAGIDTVEPAFGLPAIWISEDKKEKAQIAGYTVVDCTTVMTTHLTEIIKKHAHELIGRQEVQNLLDNLLKTYPKLVEELVPNVLSLGTIMRILQNLLKEGVSIRDLRTILETMADWAPATQDTDVLTEYVRHALSRTICSQLEENGIIPLITLSKNIEDTIQQSIQHREQGSYLSIDPQAAQKILDAIGETSNAFQGGQQPALLAAPQIRPHVRSLTERYYPALTVISHNEIAPNLKVKSLGTVTINAS